MTAEPRDFQVDAVTSHVAALRRGQIGRLEGSVPGFGKTFVAAFAAREMNHELVVACPKVVRHHWEHAAALCGAKVRCVSNWEQHKLGHTGMGIWERAVSKRRKKIFNFETGQMTEGPVTKSFGGTWRWTFPRPTLLVLDEVHLAKSATSQNAKLVTAARRQGIPTLAMSATAAVDPTDLYALGYLLDLHDGENHSFKSFQYKHGCLAVGYALKYCPADDPTALDRLNKLIYPAHGHRKNYDDIPGFPKATTDVRAVDGQPEKLEELDAAWARTKELEQLHEDATTSATARLRARQIAELAKVPAIIDLARDLVASGLSVPIFLNFHDSIDEVSQALGSKVIDGRVSDSDRTEAIRRFQSDEDHHLALQTGAGGVGISLHDTRGARPRHGLYSPPENARDLVQALGRIRRDGQKTPAFRTILTLAGSIEEVVRRNVERKSGQIDTINDGDLDPLFQ